MGKYDHARVVAVLGDQYLTASMIQEKMGWTTKKIAKILADLIDAKIIEQVWTLQDGKKYLLFGSAYFPKEDLNSPEDITEEELIIKNI